MPQINSDTIESVQATEEVIKQHCDNMQSPVKRYELFRALKKSFKVDDQSRVLAFEQHVINSRRQSVIEMFYKQGKDYEQIAKSLQISEGIVREDIRWNSENKGKKKFLLSTNR
jgi:DNA-directed RNA polymerase specialized sigma subunit